MDKYFRTIVGGRSTAYQGLKNFPRGIEILLKKVKVDHQFQEYTSTEQWLATTNPLERYIKTAYLFDPWKRKFHYEGVKDDAGTVTGYRLESLGSDTEDPQDNISCPIEPDIHRFFDTD